MVNFQVRRRLSDLVLDCCDPLDKIPIKNPTPIEVGKSLTTLINQNWKTCKIDFNSSGHPIKLGALVMAKMASYSPWPARVDGLTKNNKRVFFGENNVGSVNTNEIVNFSECHSVIRLLLLQLLTLKRFKVFHQNYP